jgi:glycosidase
VWLSPVLESPQKDYGLRSLDFLLAPLSLSFYFLVLLPGYDISNYREVDPLFGTMADLDTLLSKTLVFTSLCRAHVLFRL